LAKDLVPIRQFTLTNSPIKGSAKAQEGYLTALKQNFKSTGQVEEYDGDCDFV